MQLTVAQNTGELLANRAGINEQAPTAVRFPPLRYAGPWSTSIRLSSSVGDAHTEHCDDPNGGVCSNGLCGPSWPPISAKSATGEPTGFRPPSAQIHRMADLNGKSHIQRKGHASAVVAGCAQGSQYSLFNLVKVRVERAHTTLVWPTPLFSTSLLTRFTDSHRTGPVRVTSFVDFATGLIDTRFR
jgi:hypothetical protein